MQCGEVAWHGLGHACKVLKARRGAERPGGLFSFSCVWKSMRISPACLSPVQLILDGLGGSLIEISSPMRPSNHVEAEVRGLATWRQARGGGSKEHTPHGGSNRCPRLEV